MRLLGSGCRVHVARRVSTATRPAAENAAIADDSLAQAAAILYKLGQ